MSLELQQMAGQWIGRAYPDDEDPALIVVNIEPRTPSFARLVGINPTYGLRTVSEATVQLDSGRFVGTTLGYRVFDPARDQFVPLVEYHRQQGGQKPLPSESTYDGKFDGKTITGTFENDLKQQGRFELRKGFSEMLSGETAPQPETIGPMTWADFKHYVAQFRARGRVLFRGQQSNKFALRTSFHRSGRNDLFRYLNDDVGRLRHQINALASRYYQPGGEDLLGLLSLAQHHGFPTPLLDWTESPYVAAFFAFDCATDLSSWRGGRDQSPVRVYAFDLARWRYIDRQRATSLSDPWPDFQFLHPPAHNNPRYYPQQSMAAFSNIDDIEGFIGTFKAKHKVNYLTRIDIQAEQRELVESELRFMGITSATLFPGIEGACKALRAELF
jgi:hypothetical protein